jgi:hypothetical protein
MSSWENALRDMQGSTGQGGAPRPASPGNMGNIPYAPGMMNFGGSQSTQPQSLGRLKPGPQGPSPRMQSGPPPTTGGTVPPTGQPGGMDPQTAQMYVQMLMRAIDADLARQRSPYGAF